MDRVEQFKAIVLSMADTYAKKNKDYNNSFDKTLDKWGPNIALARIEDKFNRAVQIIENPAQIKEETVEDTLKDLASYAIMFLMWLKSPKAEAATIHKAPAPTDSEELNSRLQKFINGIMPVAKGLNSGGWPVDYILGNGRLTNIRVMNDKVLAHFDNIKKNGKTVGSGTADAVYPLEQIALFGFTDL